MDSAQVLLAQRRIHKASDPGRSGVAAEPANTIGHQLPARACSSDPNRENQNRVLAHCG